MGNLVPDNEENAKLCLCPGCPTYKKSNLTGNVFCARGKKPHSRLLLLTAGAQLCGLQKYGLDQMYYCIKGKSVDIKA